MLLRTPFCLKLVIKGWSLHAVEFLLRFSSLNGAASVSAADALAIKHRATVLDNAKTQLARLVLAGEFGLDGCIRFALYVETCQRTSHCALTTIRLQIAV
jgi:hypothetical protein